MILTVALNPGIEKHIRLQHLTQGAEIPIEDYHLRVANSSVYSAVMMKLLQADPYVLGFVGGIGGRFIKNYLDRNRVKSNLIQKDQELQSTFIIESGQDQATKLVDNSHQFEEVDRRNLKHRMVGQIDESELLVLNGYLDGGVGDEMLLEAMSLATTAHKKTVLFVEGGKLEPFLQKKPYSVVVTPAHMDEFEQGDRSLHEQLVYLRSIIIHHKIHDIIYVTSDQVICVTKNKIVYGDPQGLTCSQVSWRVDAIVGGLSVGIKRHYELEKLVKLMSGIGCAIHAEKGAQICTRKEIDDCMNKIKIKVYYANGAYQLAD